MVEACWGLAYLAWPYWMTSTHGWGRLRQVEAGWCQLRQDYYSHFTRLGIQLYFDLHSENNLYSNSWPYTKANLIDLSDLFIWKDLQHHHGKWNLWVYDLMKLIIYSGLVRCIRTRTVLCAQRSAVARIEHNAEALLQPFPSNALKRCYIHFLSSLNARISCVVACSWIIALCYQTHNTSSHLVWNFDVCGIYILCKHIFVEKH